MLTNQSVLFQSRVGRYTIVKFVASMLDFSILNWSHFRSLFSLFLFTVNNSSAKKYCLIADSN